MIHLSDAEIRAITTHLLNNRPIPPRYRRLLYPGDTEGSSERIGNLADEGARFLKRVLLIENDLEIRRQIRHELSLADFVVVDIPSGQDVFNLFNRIGFDIVLGSLSDMRLDDASTIVRMHDFISETQTPMILMVTPDEIPEGITCIQCGAYDLMLKPVIPYLLSMTLETTLLGISLHGFKMGWSDDFSDDLVGRLTDPSYEPVSSGPVTIRQMPDAFLLSFIMPDIGSRFESLPLDEWLTYIHGISDIISEVTSRYDVTLIRNSGFEFLAASPYDPVHPDANCLLPDMALALKEAFSSTLPAKSYRFGLSAGSIITGEQGDYRKIWGETVEKTLMLNLEGLDGAIQVDEKAYQRLRSLYHFEARVKVAPDYYHEIQAYLLGSRLAVPNPSD